jgi:hypothetical protein
MKLKDLSQSKTLRGIIIGLCIFLAIALIFQAGVFVGYKKAEFSGHFGDNYSRAFGGDRPEIGMMKNFPRDIFTGGHGAAGKILRISLSSIVVADRDNVEKVIAIDTDTSVKNFRNDIKVADLKIGDFVVVLGSPDEGGQIIAKLIRLMPEPPMDSNPRGVSSTSPVR